MLRGRVPTAEVEEASVVVVLAVVAMSAAGAAARGQLEVEAVSVAVASTQQPRRSVVRADPLEGQRPQGSCLYHEPRYSSVGGRPSYRKLVDHNGRVGRSVLRPWPR